MVVWSENPDVNQERGGGLEVQQGLATSTAPNTTTTHTQLVGGLLRKPPQQTVLAVHDQVQGDP